MLAQRCISHIAHDRLERRGFGPLRQLPMAISPNGGRSGPRHPGGGGPGGGLRGGGMGGNGVGLDSGGGSRGASFGGLGMRAIFSPFGLCTISPICSPGEEVASAGAFS